MRHKDFAAGLWLKVALWSGGAEAACRQARAIGLDISGLVDGGEYRLQLNRLTNALSDRDVRGAFLAMPVDYVRLISVNGAAMPSSGRGWR